MNKEKILFDRYFYFGIISTILFLVFLLNYFSPIFPHYHILGHSTNNYFQTVRKWSINPPSDEREKLARFLKIISFWFGTKYDFNGDTAVPYDGRIACGYFVNRVLNDMGYTNDVEELSQLSASRIINFYSKPEEIFFSTNESNNFGYIKSNLRGDNFGLYLIGLDTHVGFLYKVNEDYYFIHASKRFPYCVISQKMFLSSTIKDSKIIYIGKI